MYTITVTVILLVFNMIFSYLMGWDTFVENSWGYRKKIIDKYIRNYVIRPLNLYVILI